MAHSETRLADCVRCEADFGTDPINSDKSRAGAKPKGEVVADILSAIKERRT